MISLAWMACARPTTPRAEAVAPQVHAFRIGGLAAFAVRDGALELPNDGKTVGLGHPPAEVGALLAAAGQPRDRVALSVQPLVVKAGARVLLFDAGFGDPAHGGLLVRSLALAGIAPASITDVFVSHAHTDHVGGLIDHATGHLAFPAATIHLTSAEWAALRAEAATDAEARTLVAAITPAVAAFEPGAQLLPEVTAVDTHGHTAGHASYDIASNGEHLFYLGDVAHSFVISVQRPAWPIEFDGDAALAAQVRHDTLAHLAATHARVFAFHFPFPGLGTFAADGDAWIWQPEP